MSKANWTKLNSDILCWSQSIYSCINNTVEVFYLFYVECFSDIIFLVLKCINIF